MMKSVDQGLQRTHGLEALAPEPRHCIKLNLNLTGRAK
jgi:hypothetical protein